MWRRALAFLIDLLPFVLLAIIQNIAGIAESSLVGLVNFILMLGYFAGMDYRYGGTLGKRMVGLRVALPASPNVLGQLIGRAIVKMVCIFPPLATIYGLIAIWRSDGRSLADFISGSTVVEAFTLAPPKDASLLGKIVASVLIMIAPWVLMLAIMLAVLGWVLVSHWEEILPWISLFMLE